MCLCGYVFVRVYVRGNMDLIKYITVHCQKKLRTKRKDI